jgi:hypothetical protein
VREPAGAPARGGPEREDRFSLGRQLADAVLYEGYVLYPYRASAAKNQVRWQFGVLGPAGAPGDGPETPDPCTMRTQCLLDAADGAGLWARARFLRVRARVIEQAEPGGWRALERLEVADGLLTSWEEGVEHHVDSGRLAVAELLEGGEAVRCFELARVESEEPLAPLAGDTPARLRYVEEALEGELRVGAQRLGGEASGLIRVTVEVENAASAPAGGRPARLRRSLVGLHVLLACEGGRFVSLVDPPEEARAAADACANSGWFPVLVDAEDQLVLSSPIILYDHPEIAPESPGDLFDATEIDELLALRVLTMTEEEKREARATDVRAAAVVERCDSLPPEVFARLHGAVRSLRPVGAAGGAGAGGEDVREERAGEADAGGEEAGAAEAGASPGEPQTPAGEALLPGDVPWWDPAADASVDPGRDTVLVAGTPVGRGAAVRLRPRRWADAQDLFLDGLRATVAGVFHDVDGKVHVAVTVDDDPATELQQVHGRYRYFSPEELEVLEDTRR